jgi:hypothetical protein
MMLHQLHQCPPVTVSSAESSASTTERTRQRLLEEQALRLDVLTGRRPVIALLPTPQSTVDRRRSAS